MNNQTKGFFYALSAAFFFAFIAIIGKQLVTNGISPYQIAFLQYGMIVLILGIGIFIKNPVSLKVTRSKLRGYLILGILGSAFTNIFFYSALTYIDAGMTSMLLFIYPAYVTLYFTFNRTREITYKNYLAVFLTLIGAYLILGLFNSKASLSLLGIHLGVISGISYAFYNIYADIKCQDENPNVVNFYASIFGFLFCLLLLLFTRTPLSFNYSLLPNILMLSIFSGILPIWFTFKAFHHIGSEKVSIIASLELPITLVLAYFILGESMVLVQLIGLFLVVLSNLIIHTGVKSPE